MKGGDNMNKKDILFFIFGTLLVAKNKNFVYNPYDGQRVTYSTENISFKFKRLKTKDINEKNLLNATEIRVLYKDFRAKEFISYVRQIDRMGNTTYTGIRSYIGLKEQDYCMFCGSLNHNTIQAIKEQEIKESPIRYNVKGLIHIINNYIADKDFLVLVRY